MDRRRQGRLGARPPSRLSADRRDDSVPRAAARRRALTPRTSTRPSAAATRGGFQFTGAIDEVRIYNRALSAEEIAQAARRADAHGAARPGPRRPRARSLTARPPRTRPTAGRAQRRRGRVHLRAGHLAQRRVTGRLLLTGGLGRQGQRGRGGGRLGADSYRPGEAAYGFPHACVASVPGPAAPATAHQRPGSSSRSAGLNALPRAYGNVRIRGIDVFQVVQPRTRGRTCSATCPDRRFSGLCGGGTLDGHQPVAPARGRVPPRRSRSAVRPTTWASPSTATKPARPRSVYVDVDHGTPTDPNLKYFVEVSATRAGGASLGAPVVIPVQQSAAHADVVGAALRARRAGLRRPRAPAHRMDLGGRVDPVPRAPAVPRPLRLRHRRLRGARVRRGAPCEADNAFTLNDVPFASYPQLLIATIELRRSTAGQGQLPSARNILARALTLFPGGGRMTVMPFQADLDITAASNFTATADAAPATTFTCNGASYNPPTNPADPNDAANRLNAATRSCRDNAVYAVALTWIRQPGAPHGAARQPDQPHLLRRRDGGPRLQPAQREPGAPAPRGATSPPSRRRSRASPRARRSSPPRRGRGRSPRRPTSSGTSSPHPHASTCNGATGTEPWPEVDRTLASEQGRLQSVKFVQAPIRLRGSSSPVVRSNATVDGPYTLAGGGPANPQLFDLMSYCAGGDTANNDGTAWLSARNWNRFARELGELAARVGLDARPRAVAAAAPAGARAAADGEQRPFAVGVVGSGGGRVTRVVPPDGDDAASAGDPSSPYALRSLGPDGRVLLQAPVDVRGSSESPDGQGGAFAGPVAAGAVAVELLRDGTVLHRLDARDRPRSASSLRGAGSGSRAAAACRCAGGRRTRTAGTWSPRSSTRRTAGRGARCTTAPTTAARPSPARRWPRAAAHACG